MAGTLSKPIAKVKSNAIGAVAGGVLVFWASKKYMGVEKMWMRVGLTLVGAVAGAYAQSMISANASKPTAKTTK